MAGPIKARITSDDLLEQQAGRFGASADFVHFETAARFTCSELRDEKGH